MIYRSLREAARRFLKVPAGPPEAPAGSHASIQIYRASPRYLQYRLITFWISVTLAWMLQISLFAASLISGEWEIGLVGAVGLVPLVFFQVFGYFAVRIDYEVRYYILTDRSIRVRQGAWTVREMTISHANVQNLRVVQGPLLRLFGIWSLQVQTAGGGGAVKAEAASSHTVQMAGIENAHEVRDLVLAHLRARRDGAGLGDLDDSESRRRPASASPELFGALAAVRDSAASLRRAVTS